MKRLTALLQGEAGSAFESEQQMALVRLGVLTGSLLSAALGWTVPRLARRGPEAA
jgi:Na+/H+ antiporter NhaA